MSYATLSVSDALLQLGEAVKNRCKGNHLPAGVSVVRTPVALMFVRGDRAEPGASTARQVVASFGYWNRDSSKYLDLVFFAWAKDGDHIIYRGDDDSRIFVECCEEVARLSKWRYSGETDVLLVDFEMPVFADDRLGAGKFSFRNCIYLPVERMIAEKRIRSLDELVHELVAEARVAFDKDPLQVSAFHVSDRIAWTRGRRAIVDRFKALFLQDFSKMYDELRPFAVCNLSI